MPEHGSNNDRHCAKCRNHNIKSQLKGHKNYCPYKHCECEQCNKTICRQKVMAADIKIRRRAPPPTRPEICECYHVCITDLSRIDDISNFVRREGVRVFVSVWEMAIPSTFTHNLKFVKQWNAMIVLICFMALHIMF